VSVEHPHSSWGTATRWCRWHDPTVAGIPTTEPFPAGIAALIQRTRDGGAEIVKLLKTAAPSMQIFRGR
jgi:malate/lactate dehydrogenase